MCQKCGTPKCDCPEVVSKTGTKGERGGPGAKGNPGCNPDITATSVVVGEGEPIEVTVVKTGTLCAPSYEFQFPQSVFTVATTGDVFTDAVNALIDLYILTAGFITYIGTLISNWINSNTTYTTIAAAGTDVFMTRVAGTNTAAVITDVAGNFTYNIFGKKMYLDYDINFNMSNNSNDTTYDIELLIPATKTRAKTTQQGVMKLGVGGTATATFSTGVILKTNSSVNRRLKSGISILGSFPTANDVRFVELQGQIVFEIN